MITIRLGTHPSYQDNHRRLVEGYHTRRREWVLRTELEDRQRKEGLYIHQEKRQSRT
jgi:hypothetical protein